MYKIRYNLNTQVSNLKAVLKYCTCVNVLLIILSILLSSFTPFVLLQNALSPTIETTGTTLSTASLKMPPYWSFFLGGLHPRPCQLCCGTGQTLTPATQAGEGFCGAVRSGWPRE